jgi:hypothetical protein
MDSHAGEDRCANASFSSRRAASPCAADALFVNMRDPPVAPSDGQTSLIMISTLAMSTLTLVLQVLPATRAYQRVSAATSA